MKCSSSLAQVLLSNLAVALSLSISERNGLTTSLTTKSFVDGFHTYDEIVDYCKEMENENDLARTESVGTTFEGREILLITISSDYLASKPIVYLDCGLHGREWLTVSTCVWIINELLTSYNTSDEIKNLVDSYDWYIIPVGNPDGYSYTWTDDRLWRKNRRFLNYSSCVGVDPFQNFDIEFDGIASNADPCSTWYIGPYAFSEAETVAVRDVLIRIQSRAHLLVTFHEHNQVIASPYGFTTEPPADYFEMEKVMKAASEAMENTHGLKFPYGSAPNVMYLISATSVDYAYATLGVVHSYGIELRNSTEGFEPSPNAIPLAATETWNGVKAMAAEISKIKANA